MKPRPEDTRAWVACVVRSGLDEPADVLQQVVEAIRADHPELDAATTALDWIATAREDWLLDARSWPRVTDHDRLTEVFASLEESEVVVLQGCADHWAARDELKRRTPRPRGIAWFTPADVWHAVDEGMLEVNLWHGDTANAAAGDALLDEVIETFESLQLEAHFDEGRIEVAAYWQRRPE